MSASSVNIAVSAVRFLYGVTLGQETLNLMASVPRLSGRSQDRFDLTARVDFCAPVDALHVRHRYHQVDRLSAQDFESGLMQMSDSRTFSPTGKLWQNTGSV